MVDVRIINKNGIIRIIKKYRRIINLYIWYSFFRRVIFWNGEVEIWWVV